MQSRSVLLQWIGGFWWVFLPCPLVGFFHLLNLGLFHSCGSCGFWWFLGFFPWWVFGFFHSFSPGGFHGFFGKCKEVENGEIVQIVPCREDRKRKPKNPPGKPTNMPQKSPQTQPGLPSALAGLRPASAEGTAQLAGSVLVDFGSFFCLKTHRSNNCDRMD